MTKAVTLHTKGQDRDHFQLNITHTHKDSQRKVSFRNMSSRSDHYQKE